MNTLEYDAERTSSSAMEKLTAFCEKRKIEIHKDSSVADGDIYYSKKLRKVVIGDYIDIVNIDVLKLLCAEDTANIVSVTD